MIKEKIFAKTEGFLEEAFAEGEMFKRIE